MANLQSFQWQQHPFAEALLLSFQESFLKANSSMSRFESDLLKNTSTRLFDWIDHYAIVHCADIEAKLEEAGFVFEDATASYRVFHHPGAQLPRVVVHDKEKEIMGIAVSVDSIADFLQVHGVSSWVEGSAFSRFRKALVAKENDVAFWVVERRASTTMEPVYQTDSDLALYWEAKEKWQTRSRGFIKDDAEVMNRTLAIAEEIVSLVGKDLAAWIILECERAYWQSKNTAGQVQKNRQDRMGMGWANHDHHTFRSSRKNFSKLIRLFEILGFHCRERYWAGQEAGWGAQIMENSICKLVLFLDVDLGSDEVGIDFAHNSLQESKELGTIGLWCALHGDSILQGGMHHLEAQFMFDSLTEDLSSKGIGMMKAFSNFPYLKQAFTAGEIWQVDGRRLDILLKTGQITKEQAEKFRAQGAVGSHLENLQRREGYKGFNQKNVSVIIKETDPRKLSQ